MAAGRASNPAGKRSAAPPAAIVDRTALGPAQSQTREVRGVRLAPGRGGDLARQHVERAEHPFIIVQDKSGRYKPLFHEFRPKLFRARWILDSLPPSLPPSLPLSPIT